ncbi:hypothetical protein XENORESO_020542 [Xenotaenia resolanae]|uniref:Uncharacterized protein n=1 Tax=Xenotaenia resolanae TaxID=208358 RepID=A0ABV0VNC4_9TELE
MRFSCKLRNKQQCSLSGHSSRISLHFFIQLSIYFPYLLPLYPLFPAQTSAPLDLLSFLWDHLSPSVPACPSPFLSCHCCLVPLLSCSNYITAPVSRLPETDLAVR